MSSINKKPWSMSSGGSPHTTNTTLGTNIDDLHTTITISSGGFSMNKYRTNINNNKHNDGMHSQIGDTSNKMLVCVSNKIANNKHKYNQPIGDISNKM